MSKLKKMIFHIPMQLDTNHASGSQIRPYKMIEAFKDIGYEVDIIMGYVKERKEQIRTIKEQIKNGIKYAFVYSESSTMPTALTEKNHLPMAPFLDFEFFRFCKDNGIKIGLFYRDIYWMLNDYKEQVPFLNRIVAKFFYKYDLKNYKKYVDILYLPSKQMFEHMPISFNTEVLELPPAIERRDITPKQSISDISFIYVGGIGNLYDLRLFSQVISNLDGMVFNLCTREKEWCLSEQNYSSYENLKVFHKQGKELDILYNQSDIAVYFLKPDILWNFAMGLKLFEYLSYKKPIIAVEGTAVGKFVEKYSLGWVINYDEDELKNLLLELKSDTSKIEEKRDNIEKIIQDNTWEARATQVQKDLCT